MNAFKFVSAAMLALACASSPKPSEDAQRAAAKSAECVAALTAKCEFDIATKCNAGDEQCPAYLDCMDKADKVERGELCK